MFLSRLKYRRNFLQSILTNFFRWHLRIHVYSLAIVLTLACAISYYQPFGLIYNLTHLLPERPSIIPIREKLISKQKEEQREAYEWLDNLWKNSKKYAHIISNRTEQSRFYDFIHSPPLNATQSSYQLFDKPKQIPLHSSMNVDDQIIISILYSQQDTDHRDGKFYVGQVLQHLLKHYHSRFIITLCENNNTDAKVSDEIDLIRRLVPVFLINTSPLDIYEQEKQAHLQCILANFQSFPNQNYFLLLQDDAQPTHHDFYQRILSLIDNRIKQQWPLDGHRSQPAFLKIYHPRWLIDYLHPSFYLIVQLIATGLFLTYVSFVCFYLIHFFLRLFRSNTNQSWSNSIKSIYHLMIFNSNWFLFLYYFLLITLVLILLNHSNVSWSWRSLHPSLYAIYPAPSCCLPGVLYFRSTYIQVIDYLNHVKCHNGYAIDSAFDDLPKRIDLRTYLVEPNLVHHIGLYSRLRHMYINPYLLD